MTEQITLEIHAEASGVIAAQKEAIWRVLADIGRRPNLTSSEPLAGVWPDETASVRTIVDKGSFEMVRIETVIRSIPQERLIVKVDAPQWGSSAYLDHRIEPVDGGCRLTIGVIAIASYPAGAGPASREDYAALTRQGLQDAVALYRTLIEGDAA